jgi:hypothetical protein
MWLPFHRPQHSAADDPPDMAAAAGAAPLADLEQAMRALDVIEADVRRAMRELKRRRAQVPPTWQAAPQEYIAMLAIREGWAMSLGTLVKTYRHLGQVPPLEVRRFVQDWYLRERRDLGDALRDATAWYAAWTASGYPSPREPASAE